MSNDTFKPSQPEKELITLLLDDPNQSDKIIALTNFTEYSFSSHFLQPTDGWNFVIGAEDLDDDTRVALKPGAQVDLVINGFIQSSGYIDSITISASRGAGLQYRIEGRDRLSQAVDACANPTKSFKEGQTLSESLKTLFAPFGWDTEEKFVADNTADKQLRNKTYRSKTKTSEAKGFSKRALKTYKNHQLRPYPKEGVFEFASRLSQRFGLWIWSSADGETLIVSTPDFDQDPDYKLIRNREGTTNVLDGSVKISMLNQPTHIVADGYSKGGEFGKSKIVVIMPNVAVETPEAPELEPYIKAGAKVLGGHTFPASSSMNPPRLRVIYMHDDESQNIEQLEAFVRREMALLQRQSLEVSYTVEGHGQIVNGNFIPWAVDRVVDVDDEPAGLREKLYIMGVTFEKSRSGGTTTKLELIRLNTLVFTDTDTKKR